MENREVRIKNLILRLPGGYEGEAESISREVIQQVAAGLPSNIKNEKLESLSFKINVQEGASQNMMVTRISEAIIKGLQ